MDPGIFSSEFFERKGDTCIPLPKFYCLCDVPSFREHGKGLVQGNEIADEEEDGWLRDDRGSQPACLKPQREQEDHCGAPCHIRK